MAQDVRELSYAMEKRCIMEKVTAWNCLETIKMKSIGNIFLGRELFVF